jgi:hypothetical protein
LDRADSIDSVGSGEAASIAEARPWQTIANTIPGNTPVRFLPEDVDTPQLSQPDIHDAIG